MNENPRAGRVKSEDLALLKERVRIDDVVSDYVTLKNAGGGSLKGLCPFHDERSPSFNVTPSRGLWFCFGCGEGGDSIEFLRRIDHLSFPEAVERLAEKAGMALNYEDVDPDAEARRNERLRLYEANKHAARFYESLLKSDEAVLAKDFLNKRGFNDSALEEFKVGYSPKAWDSLTQFLHGLGFSDDELVAAGLSIQGQRGLYDRFRGRIMWPISDITGHIVGFGARKLHDDDDGPKYLNTPETLIYKKSHVLYGIDKSRKPISKKQQAVVVEGYTDVMACHLAGVDTAVATCGTSFGEGHIAILRRLLLDDGSTSTEVIFTFDGDGAGQKAALRAFENDQRFLANTFIAVADNNMDPCDLRLSEGDEGIRNLLASRIPLFQFAIKNALEKHDLKSAEGRVSALREAAPIVARIKDPALRPEYTRLLAGWVGMNPDEVARAVKTARKKDDGSVNDEPVSSSRDVSASVQREALKVALQDPASVAYWYESVEDSAFTNPDLLMVHRALVKAGGPKETVSGRVWTERVLVEAETQEAANMIRALSVEPIDIATPITEYGVGVMARLLEMDASRRIDDLKSRMAQADADGNSQVSIAIFEEIVALDQYRRELRLIPSEETGH